jgi:hypothetical protein
LDPVQDSAIAFAPATIANLGPGFDWLGCAVEVGSAGCTADTVVSFESILGACLSAVVAWAAAHQPPQTFHALAGRWRYRDSQSTGRSAWQGGH